MPRPRKISDEVEIAPTPRKRVSRPRVVADTAVEVPRRRSSRAVASTDVVTASPEEVRPRATRKAPTPIASTTRTQTKRRTQLLVVAAVAVVVASVGVAVGFSDKGSIDVVASITEQNERINRGEVRDASGAVISGSVPVQNAGNIPNGGLKPVDEGAVPPPAELPEPVSSVATSTDTAATSTESVADTASSSAEGTENTAP